MIVGRELTVSIPLSSHLIMLVRMVLRLEGLDTRMMHLDFRHVACAKQQVGVDIAESGCNSG